MPLELSPSGGADLAAAFAAIRTFQRDDVPVQLHPGDLGWHERFGPDAVAAVVRTWSRDGRVVAVGMLDSADLVRLAIDPDLDEDEGFARDLAASLDDPAAGVLPAGSVAVEARWGAALRRELTARGWVPDEPWTPFRLDLSVPIEAPDLRIETAGPAWVEERVAVQRAAFPNSTFTVERWHVLAAGPLYADARCLVGFEPGGAPAAVATVWSAGVGRPGLIEPLGADPAHRGHGYGRQVSVAAAIALQDLGSSSAFVCTPSSNTGGVAAYRSAGFTVLPEVRDLRRPA